MDQVPLACEDDNAKMSCKLKNGVGAVEAVLNRVNHIFTELKKCLYAA